MTIYGDSFLTRERWHTRSRIRAERSRFIWRRCRWATMEKNIDPHAEDCWELSLLGIINGTPIVSRWWRLAAIAEGASVIRWRVVRASRFAR